MSDIHVLENEQAAAQEAASHIIGALAKVLEAGDRARLAVSGGSTPKMMFAEMAARAADLDWKRVDIFWVDERMVPPGHADSNFSSVEAALIHPLRLDPWQVYRIEGERAPDDAAERYAARVRGAFGIAKDELPRFDVIHLGLGSDGHTASLFPGEPRIDDRLGLTAALEMESKKAWRVTLLPGALVQAAEIVFLATGKPKAAALRAARGKAYNHSLRPAQLIEREGSHVVWFVDQAAAGKTVTSVA